MWPLRTCQTGSVRAGAQTAELVHGLGGEGLEPSRDVWGHPLPLRALQRVHEDVQLLPRPAEVGGHFLAALRHLHRTGRPFEAGGELMADLLAAEHFDRQRPQADAQHAETAAERVESDERELGTV